MAQKPVLRGEVGARALRNQVWGIKFKNKKRTTPSDHAKCSPHNMID
jgi:hypothetical protein